MIEVNSKSENFSYGKLGLPNMVMLRISINTDELKKAYKKEHYTYDDICQMVGHEILKSLKGPLEE